MSFVFAESLDQIARFLDRFMIVKPRVNLLYLIVLEANSQAL